MADAVVADDGERGEMGGEDVERAGDERGGEEAPCKQQEASQDYQSRSHLHY